MGGPLLQGTATRRSRSRTLSSCPPLTPAPVRVLIRCALSHLQWSRLQFFHACLREAYVTHRLQQTTVSPRGWQADGGGITRNANGEKVSPFWEAGRDKLAKAQKRHTSDAVQNNEDGTEGALTNRVR